MKSIFAKSQSCAVRLLARATVDLSVPIGASTGVMACMAFEMGRGLKFESWVRQDIESSNA